jgi:hypothetical protein
MTLCAMGVVRVAETPLRVWLFSGRVEPPRGALVYRL